jgi:hypothetical protein
MTIEAMSITAMRQALEALGKCRYRSLADEIVDPAITALRTAIEQEPVAWEDVLGAIARGWTHPENAQKPMDVQLAVAIAKEIQDMYTTPPAAQRRPLTDAAKAVIDAARAAMDESVEAYDSEGSIKIASHLAASLSICLDEYDRATEAAHGIGGEA